MLFAMSANVAIVATVNPVPGAITSVDTIANRVRAATAHVAPERITLNPDCGFAPGSGARVSIDEVYQKLRNEASAAAVLREMLG